VTIPDIADLLTSRQREVAALVAKGLSNKQVAQHLNLGEGTVKIHLHHILTKLAVKNRTVLAVMIRRGQNPDVVKIEEGAGKAFATPPHLEREART
jgi:DNA-binding NarL/FixJ family response regulator